MDAVKIILDPGSTHMGELVYMRELCDLAIEAGADIIKPQLGVKPPNIDFPLIWWDDISDYCKGKILLIGSFFTDEAFDFLIQKNVPFIKFAFSQKHQVNKIDKCLSLGVQPIVSCDAMSIQDVPQEAIKLFCISEYPVKYRISFDCLFPRFDGFSDHTLGFWQTLEAVSRGAKWIEKHITLDKPEISCPDNRFALDPLGVKQMINYIRGKNENKRRAD